MFYNIFHAFFAQKICACQIKAVTLRQKSEKVLYFKILPAKRTGQRWGATREE